MTSGTPNKSAHIPALQSLRGIAALMVLIGHCVFYYASAPSGIFWKIVGDGSAAVVFFFVLSGFVLSKSLARRPLTAPLLGGYLVRRGFRIYPMIWAASAMSLFYLTLVRPGVHQAVSKSMLAVFPASSLNLPHIVAALAGLSAALLPPLWTIAAELVGSLLVPVLVAIQRRGPLTMAAAGVLLLGVTLFDRVSLYGMGRYLIAFYAGSLLALEAASAARRTARGPGVLAMIAVGLGVALFPYPHNPLSILARTAGASLIVAAFGAAGVRARILNWKPIVQLGEWSYSLYLLHFPIMCLGAAALLALGVDQAPFALLAVTLTVSIPLSWATYQLVELPMMGAGKQVARAAERRLRARAVATAAA
jgi:peptidoglycan/LPS O-acetylase OafA/YrhL